MGRKSGLRVARSVPAVVLLLGLAAPAAAYQVPVEPFTQARSATATMPGSGLTQTVSVTGKTELLEATTAGGRGTTAGTYQPAVAGATPAQDVVVDTGDCAATGSCGARGTLTIEFSQPVRDPILHFAGIGGAVTQTVDGRPKAQSELHSVLKLTTAALSLRKVGRGDNLAVTSDTISAADPDAGPNCGTAATGDGPDARATAACGSVQVNGVVTTVAFDITAVFTKNASLPPFNTSGSGDVFSVVASAGEDFGDAPGSYGAAWSVLSDLRLGAEVTADNTTVANATSGPATPDQADDGVTFGRLLTTTKTYSAPVVLTGATKPGRVCGWIDLNRNGSYEPAERSCATFAAGQSAATLSWTDLKQPAAGASYARVRVGYTGTLVEKPTGPADAGEVEDHPIDIAPPPRPVAADDTVTTPYDTGVSTDVLGNDKAGDPTTPLRPGSLCLVHAETCGQSVTLAGQGKYVAKADGRIDFDPVPGFFGRGQPVTYRIADTNGATDEARLTVTVSLPAAPVATPDTVTTPQNVGVVLHPLLNDEAAPGVTFDPGSLVLRDPADAVFKQKVVVPAEGTYTVKPAGTVGFVPAARFTGIATTIGYRVADTTRQVAESTLVVTVSPVVPKALGDSVATAFGTDVEIEVLDNDLPGSVDVPLNPASLALVDPVSGRLTPKVTIAGQGVYQVAKGKVSFAPATGFQGTTTSVTYQVRDGNGTAARAQLVVSVAAPGPPVANPDAVTSLQGRPISVGVLDNDTAGPTGSALVPGSVRLLPPTRSEPTTELEIPGQGSYTVKPDGRIRFEPVLAFHGKVKPVRYQVADGNGAIGRATLTVAITRVQPDAVDDTATTGYDKRVTVDVLANDSAGDAAVPLVPSNLRLLDPVSGSPREVVTVAGEATYKVRPDGKVEVDPRPTFTGVMTPLTYLVTDVNGTPARATLTVTIAKPKPPSAESDTATGKQDESLTLEPLGNDKAGQGTRLDPLSLVLVDPADGSLKKAVTVAGQARFQVNADGTVGFDPVPSFTGAATAINYRVSDGFDQTGRSTITVTVTPITPVAVDDSTTTANDATVSVPVLANDRPGDPSAPLVPSSLRLRDPGDGGFKTSVTVPGEGVFTVRLGAVVFDPLTTFTGPATELTYQVADDNGTPATAVLRITVGASPIARPDTASTVQDVTVSVNVLSNDSPGTDAKLDPASVVVREATARSGDFVKTLEVAGQGTYRVQPTGMVVFDPVPAFRGEARQLTYRVADSSRRTATATLGLTVEAIEPFTVDDTGITPAGESITVDVLANDQAGDPSAALVPGSLRLKDPADGSYRRKVTQPREGVYIAHGDGTITFTPAKNYQGVTTPATYRVTDVNGSTAEGLLFLTVGQGPVAKPDTATTKQNVGVTVELLANDEPGTDAELQKELVRVFGPGRTWDRRATIAGQGTFSVDAVTGNLTFTPVPAYSGPSSIAYQVTDTTGNKAASTVTITVTSIAPDAADDTVTTPFDTPVTLAVLANDKAGDAEAPLVSSTVRVIDPATGDPESSLRVVGQGTYTVQPDGRLRFVPADGMTGAATPVTYQVSDANGATGSATLTVTVQARPVARPDLVRTGQARPVTFDPLANDKAGPGASLVPATLLLLDPEGDLVTGFSVPGHGAYAVAEGKITFSPATGFTGSTRPTRYEVKDSNRNAARSTVSVTVVPVRPDAVDDDARTAYGEAVVVPVLDNDRPGDPSAPLVPSSVLLRDPADGNEKTAVTVPGEGSYTVGAEGAVDYRPAKGFAGTTRSITYRVGDANGTTDTARLEITVDGPVAAKAAGDAGTASPGNPVVVNPLLNDVPTAGADWDRTTLCLLDGSAGCADRVAVPGVGVWTAGTDGTIRLVPEDDFVGPAKVRYRVGDAEAATVESQVKVEIGAKPVAAVVPAAAQLPAASGPSVMLLTVGGLLASLGVTLLGIARRSRRR